MLLPALLPAPRELLGEVKGESPPTLEGFSPHVLHRRFQLKVHTNSNRKKSKISTQQRQYSFSDLCGGRNHLKRRSFLPPPPPTSLAMRRKSVLKLSPAARGNSPGVFPRPVFYISANPGRGLGRGHRRALRRPPQCAKEPRRCGATRIKALEWRAWGEQPAAPEPVLPPHPARKTSNPKYIPTTTEKNLNFRIAKTIFF